MGEGHLERAISRRWTQDSARGGMGQETVGDSAGMTVGWEMVRWCKRWHDSAGNSAGEMAGWETAGDSAGNGTGMMAGQEMAWEMTHGGRRWGQGRD